MSFITRNYLSHYFFFSFIIFSCSSSSISIAVLTYSPGLAQKTFQANTKKLENKALKKPNDPHTLFKASKNLTMLTYGFIMDEAERVSIEDYTEGLNIYNQANSNFKRSISYVEKSIQLEYDNYFQWINDDRDSPMVFKKEVSEKLYWAAASYAGAIQSSNGNPKWVVQLPKIGKLLEKGMELHPDWNYGAFYTAMIPYSLIRHDANQDRINIAKSYFKKAVIASKEQDLSPYIAYAENIAVGEQNKKEYTNMLYKALSIDINANPDLSLVNYINRTRANWLLDNIDEYFY